LDDTERRAAFLAALNNQYFVLQAAAGSTITESAARASLYMVSVSISLVAIALVAQSRSASGPFLAVVLPTLFILGLFTVVRLVDTGVQNFVYIQSMAQIRRYYADLVPDAAQFFGTGPDNLLAQLAGPARRGQLEGLFTIGSMVALIDCVIGGAGAALLVAAFVGGFERAPALSVGAGLGTGAALFAIFLVYQRDRYRVLRSVGDPRAPAR
jgi:hypothetical protein